MCGYVIDVSTWSFDFILFFAIDYCYVCSFSVPFICFITVSFVWSKPLVKQRHFASSYLFLLALRNKMRTWLSIDQLQGTVASTFQGCFRNGPLHISYPFLDWLLTKLYVFSFDCDLHVSARDISFVSLVFFVSNVNVDLNSFIVVRVLIALSQVTGISVNLAYFLRQERCFLSPIKFIGIFKLVQH